MCCINGFAVADGSEGVPGECFRSFNSLSPRNDWGQELLYCLPYETEANAYSFLSVRFYRYKKITIQNIEVQMIVLVT